jgi:putative FmdB family regulatory protein
MPLYEYYCPPCGTQFEVLRPVSQMNNATTCPSGHTTNNRVLSLFAPLARGDEAPVMTMDSMGGGDSCCGGSCSCC